jgi:hypothetical protein
VPHLPGDDTLNLPPPRPTVLAFAFGYSVTLGPVLRSGLSLRAAVPFVVTVPVNRWLIGRGKGHAVTHRFHGDEHARS